MACKTHKWVDAKTDYQTQDAEGTKITLRDVTSRVCAECGLESLDLDMVLRMTHEEIARQEGITPSQANILMLIFSPVSKSWFPPRIEIKGGYVDKDGRFIEQKYRFNKMLFYFWKELEKFGLGESFGRDEFAKAARGPIPRSLKKDSLSLSKMGLIDFVSGGRDIERSFKWILTDKGVKSASRLRSRYPPEYRDTILRVKDKLFLISTKELQSKVHAEFPAWKGTEPDEETNLTDFGDPIPTNGAPA